MADNFLSQAEVDALLKGVGGNPNATNKTKDVNIRTYNLATEERIVRGSLPTLDIINEQFSRLLRSDLFNFLHRSAEVSVGAVSLSKYSEFIDGLVMPTNINLVHIKPLRGTALVVMDPNLVFLLVDNLFGGDGRFHKPVEGREFTQTEQRLILRILDIVFGAYAKAWKPVYPVEFDYIRSEMNTRFINIATPNELVVRTSVTIELGAVSGEIHFCIPYAMLEPVKDKLSSGIQGEKVETDKRWSRLITQQIQQAEVEIVADLGISHMNLGDILNLRSGDVIPLSIPDLLCVKVDGTPVMKCKYGIFNNQYALKVEKLLSSGAQEAVIDPTMETKQGAPHG